MATEVALPPLTEEGLLGTWEGCRMGMPYWYRMEIFRGAGYLAVVDRVERALYKLESRKITGTNRVSLRFRNITEKSSLPEAIRIDGIGYGLDETHGELHATLTDYVANLRQKWQVYFTKGTELSRDVAKMLKDAERLIRDAKRTQR